MAVKVCPVCGAKVKCKIKVANGGVICSLCSQLSPNYAVETVEALKEYYKTQTHRRSIFAKTRELKSVFSDTIVIDESNKLFYIYKKNYLPIIYQFDEVNGCEYIEIPPTQTISKKRGGFGRAVVGGALFGGAGAVVGASTAKTVTTQTRGLRYLSVHMHTYAGDMDIKVYSPPANAEQFFNICARTSRKEDDVDKILKYKKLLDAGAITLEQFEAKKKELLNI